MTSRRRSILAIVIPALVVFTADEGYAHPPDPRSYTKWPEDGVPIVHFQGQQATGTVLSDGEGGAFVSWTDERLGSDNSDIYIQKVTQSGVAIFPNGLPVCTAPGRQLLPEMVTDGEGGVIIAWLDERTGSQDIFAQRILASGQISPSWPIDGIGVCTAYGIQTDPVITSDGVGGAFIAWTDGRISFPESDIFVQRILGSGSIAEGWPVDGVRLSGTPGAEYEPDIVSDKNGGAIVAWISQRYDVDADIRALRVTSLGGISTGWPDSGFVLCSAPGRQDFPVIVSDGAGGAIIVWRDYRRGPAESDIYAQRIMSPGVLALEWPENGILVGTAPGIPKACSDGFGGALIGWFTGSYGAPNILVQRLMASGAAAPGWIEGGVSVGTSTGALSAPSLVPDGLGGAIVAWNDYRGPSILDIYAQRLSSDGRIAPGWPDTGVPLCTAPGEQDLFASSARVSPMAQDGAEGAIVAWNDWIATGDSPNSDIRAQRVTSNGIAGPGVCQHCGWIESVFANPGRGRFSMQVRAPAGGIAVIEVHDVRGRLVWAGRYDNLPSSGSVILDLDLSRTSSGIFFIRYRDRDDRVLDTRKLAVVH